MFGLSLSLVVIKRIQELDYSQIFVNCMFNIRVLSVHTHLVPVPLTQTAVFYLQLVKETTLFWGSTPLLPQGHGVIHEHRPCLVQPSVKFSEQSITEPLARWQRLDPGGWFDDVVLDVSKYAFLISAMGSLPCSLQYSQV